MIIPSWYCRRYEQNCMRVDLDVMHQSQDITPRQRPYQTLQPLLIAPIDQYKEFMPWVGSKVFRAGCNAPISWCWHVIEPLVSSPAHDYGATERLQRPNYCQLPLYMYSCMRSMYIFHHVTDIICGRRWYMGTHPMVLGNFCSFDGWRNFCDTG
jgi:hypothetical protein